MSSQSIPRQLSFESLANTTFLTCVADDDDDGMSHIHVDAWEQPTLSSPPSNMGGDLGLGRGLYAEHLCLNQDTQLLSFQCSNDEQKNTSQNCSEMHSFDSIGSSLQKQKDICRQDTESVIINKVIREFKDNSTESYSAQFVEQFINQSDCSARAKKLMTEEIALQLNQLTLVAEARRSQLESKDQAISILKTHICQLERAHRVEQRITRKLFTECSALQKEVVQANWDKEVTEAKTVCSQEYWMERFMRCDAENSELRDSIQELECRLKCSQREKNIITKEKDEISILLDNTCINNAKESNSLSENTFPSFAHLSASRLHVHVGEDAIIDDKEMLPEDLTDLYTCNSEKFSSAPELKNLNSRDLAVLGTCHCSLLSVEPQTAAGSGKDSGKLLPASPCDCSWALLWSKKKNESLKAEVALLAAQKAEMELLLDHYRIAFEQQLTRNQAVLAALINGAKDSCQHTKSKNNNKKHNKNDNLVQSHQLLFQLIELLKERNEEALHKGISVRILATRVLQQEEEMGRLRAIVEQTSGKMSDKTVCLTTPKEHNKCQIST